MLCAMDGVTTAIVLFIFFCIAYPTLVKRRAQYYAAVAAVLFLLLLRCVGTMVGTSVSVEDGVPTVHNGFARFVEAMTYLLQFVAILLLMMSAGGLTARELVGEMGEALDEIRGGDAKTVIVPLTGEVPPPRKPRP